MQRVTLVRYAAKPDRAAENETLARAVFAELEAAAPEHVAYALFRDGLDFIHLFINAQADDSSPVTELPSFKAYAKDVIERCEAPPEPMRLSLQLLESYGLKSPNKASDGARSPIRRPCGTPCAGLIESDISGS